MNTSQSRTGKLGNINIIEANDLQFLRHFYSKMATYLKYMCPNHIRAGKYTVYIRMLCKGFSHKFIVFHGIKKLFIGYHNDFVCMCTLTGISKCNLSVIRRHMDIISGTHSSNIHQLMAALINKKFRSHHTTLIVIAFNS